MCIALSNPFCVFIWFLSRIKLKFKYFSSEHTDWSDPLTSWTQHGLNFSVMLIYLQQKGKPFKICHNGRPIFYSEIQVRHLAFVILMSLMAWHVTHWMWYLFCFDDFFQTFCITFKRNVPTTFREWAVDQHHYKKKKIKLNSIHQE